MAKLMKSLKSKDRKQAKQWFSVAKKYLLSDVGTSYLRLDLTPVSNRVKTFPATLSTPSTRLLLGATLSGIKRVRASPS